MNWFSVIVTVLLCIAPNGCNRHRIVGSGTSKTEIRDVGDFDQFELHGAARVEIAIGARKPLEVTADDNILPLLHTEVRDRRLIVRLEEPIRPEAGIVLRAAVPDIKVISCDGAADLTLKGVHNDGLLIEIHGAGKIAARGKTGRLTISISGAGDVDAEGLHARSVVVTMTGAGKVNTHAIEKLNVSIAGTGIVRYSGDPEIKKQIRGLGTVIKTK